jgi:predicted amidophosphoribosyltransferase
VRAAVAYGDVAREVALKLKYSGRLACAQTMARAMARLMPEDVDLLVPVPLHRWRIWSRGFNQAALIAAALSKASGVPMDAVAAAAGEGDAGAARAGSAGAREGGGGGVCVIRRCQRRLAGRTVVLVDDVHTSGATAARPARACSSAAAPTK